VVSDASGKPHAHRRSYAARSSSPLEWRIVKSLSWHAQPQLESCDPIGPGVTGRSFIGDPSFRSSSTSSPKSQTPTRSLLLDREPADSTVFEEGPVAAGY